MFTFETSDQKEVRRFRIAQFNGRTATARSAGSTVTGHVRSIVENKAEHFGGMDDHDHPGRAQGPAAIAAGAARSLLCGRLLLSRRRAAGAAYRERSRDDRGKAHSPARR